MLNILLIENDISQIQSLVNLLSSSISDIRIYSIKSCGNDALDVINSMIPDLIILENGLADISGLDIINYIDTHNLNNYKNSIILIDNTLNETKCNNEYIYSCISKPIDYNNLISTVKNFMNTKNFKGILTHKISQELLKLKFDFTHIGTTYLMESISYIYAQKLNSFTLNTDVYPIIAQKYNTNINTIKCDILHATSNSYYSSDESFLTTYLRVSPLNRPKPKYLISTILNKIV